MLLELNLGLVRNVLLLLANRNSSSFNSTTTGGMFRGSLGVGVGLS
jgi:hypothetical protein